ncbi:universal stress protein [Streptomyces sp. NPDC050263]|uniref:universal stress protein n=1 Tax=Streptomyces sp. NPDC050263 TaxID=3155037 RepID=UPI003424C098
MNGPVLVGVDGSSSSLAAVEAAAREAVRLGVELGLVHACEWPAASVPPGVHPWDPGGSGSCGSANGALTEAERRARSAAPAVRVTHTVLMGEAASVLETESRGASLTVVGSRPVSRAGSGRRGSVAARLAAHGSSPVLMVRGRPDSAGPVVLACDDGHVGRRAAEFAFAEASARETDVVVLNGFATRNGRPRNGLGPHDPLAALREKYGDVTVRRPRVRGGTRRAVIEASTQAQLVVVGARRRGEWPAVLQATISRAALRRAGCPVAVIHEEGENR